MDKIDSGFHDLYLQIHPDGWYNLRRNVSFPVLKSGTLYSGISGTVWPGIYSFKQKKKVAKKENSSFYFELFPVI